METRKIYIKRLTVWGLPEKIHKNVGDFLQNRTFESTEIWNETPKQLDDLENFFREKYSLPKESKMEWQVGQYNRDSGGVWKVHDFDVVMRFILNINCSEIYSFFEGKKRMFDQKLRDGEFTVLGTSMGVCPFNIAVSKRANKALPRPSTYKRFTLIIDFKSPAPFSEIVGELGKTKVEDAEKMAKKLYEENIVNDDFNEMVKKAIKK